MHHRTSPPRRPSLCGTSIGMFRSSQNLGLAVLTLAVLSVGLTARAVTPAPDGGYPNFNTAEGQDALLNLQNGIGNTAIGFLTLHKNTSGSTNTATGNQAL